MWGGLSTNIQLSQERIDVGIVSFKTYIGLMVSEDERLVRIESALAHIQQLTEALNETVIEQDKSIRRLSQRVDQLTENLADTDMKSIKDNITKPPHYQ